MSIAETLGQLALFADLSPSQLEAIAHSHEEDVFGAGERVLRKGLSGGNFFVILEGEAAVEIDGEPRAKLMRGHHFGEISALTGDPPTADVVASTTLRCLVIPAPQLERLLLDRPQLMLRMLRMAAHRPRHTPQQQDESARTRRATTTSSSSAAAPAACRRATACGGSASAMPCSRGATRRAGSCRAS